MRKLLTLALILSTIPAWASWTLNNAKQGGGTLTFANPLHNPSTIIVVCRSSSTDPTPTVTEAAGNTFVISPLGAVNIQVGGTLTTETILAAANTSTMASDTIICHTGGSIQQAAYEIYGCSPCGVFDGGVSNINQTSGAGGPNAIVSASFSTTVNGDFILMSYWDNGGAGSFTAGTSPVIFTLTGESITVIASEYATQGTHGAIAPTMGVTGAGVNWGSQAIAIAPSSLSSTRRRSQVISSQ